VAVDIPFLFIVLSPPGVVSRPRRAKGKAPALQLSNAPVAVTAVPSVAAGTSPACLFSVSRIMLFNFFTGQRYSK
jgi:hypothetical protein